MNERIFCTNVIFGEYIQILQRKFYCLHDKFLKWLIFSKLNLGNCNTISKN